jgi:hypothetical protein
MGRKLYSVMSRRRGKWFEIAKGLPERKAKLAGVKFTRRTLARSFRLEETGVGQAEDISFDVPKKWYRQPKSKSLLPKNTYVQIKALSRGTGEVPEILSAKRMKGSKLKLWK